MRLLVPGFGLLLGAACGRPPELPVVDDPCATWEAPGLYSLSVEGFDRAPLVYVPGSAGPRSAVVALHGAQKNGDDMLTDTTTFRSRADAAGYVAAFPNGSGSPTGWTWNAGTCCGPSSELDVDDVGFLEAFGKELRARLCIDRIVAAGFSNGGMMALRWGCEGQQADAVFSAGGPLLVDACPGAPFPVTLERGTADETVPVDGATNANGTAFPTLDDDVAALTADDGCTGDPTTTTTGLATCRAWSTCAAPVKACTIEGWPHRWPGASQGADGFVAEAEVEALFELATPHRK